MASTSKKPTHAAECLGVKVPDSPMLTPTRIERINATRYEGQEIAGALEVVPAMRQPTVSPLADGSAFAVRVAVRKTKVNAVIQAIREAGGSNIVISNIQQLVD